MNKTYDIENRQLNIEKGPIVHKMAAHRLVEDFAVKLVFTVSISIEDLQDAKSLKWSDDDIFSQSGRDFEDIVRQYFKEAYN